MQLKLILSTIVFVGLLPKAAIAANACIDLFSTTTTGLLPQQYLDQANRPYGGNSIFLLKGRYSEQEIYKANAQLIESLKKIFINAEPGQYSGARKPHFKMPVAVELPLKEIVKAKSADEVRLIVNNSIKASIFSTLKTYESEVVKPRLLLAGQLVEKIHDTHVPENLYDLLHIYSFELLSPQNVLGKFSFIFTNAQQVIFKLSQLDKQNKISPNLQFFLMTMTNFMDPLVIPAENASRFKDHHYSDQINPDAVNYTIAMLLSAQQLESLKWLADSLQDRTMQIFIDRVERQGTPIENP